MKHIRISLLGLGVVGSQLIRYIQNNLAKVNSAYDMQLSIGSIYVRNLRKQRHLDISGLNLTDDPYMAIRHADIVIDCMGGNGADLTRELVLSSISEHKAIIMSSKKCLAQYGQEIEQAVQANKTIFHYDATVGGGIPISSVLACMGKCEQFTRIYGICNATSNFILGEMRHYCNYQAALKKAIDLGFAENNPEEDVDGFDALYKSVIIMGFGMGHWIDCDSIRPVSIRLVTEEDLRDANQQMCLIKPVFSIEHCENNYSCYVGPKFVSKDSIMANVRGNNNIIVIDGSESGERAFFGQGAGGRPTASAMYDDLIKTVCEMGAS